jgi:hypothetical protein
MSYQAVIRNSTNDLLVFSPVGIQISILQGSSTGAPVYIEYQTTSTNANGLVSIAVGDGSNLFGSLNSIDWSAGPYFIKTETDPHGGTDFTITGTSELMSVPYALYAGNPNWNVNGNDISNTNSGNVGIGIVGNSPQQGLSIGNGMVVDQNDQCDGSLTNGLIFGSYSGEGISSDRTGMSSNPYGLGFKTDFTDRLSITNSGDIGIGTNTPGAKLEIAGNVKITDGNQGQGKVLTSDVNGVATWQHSSALAYGFIYANTVYPTSYGIAGVIRNSTGNYTITTSNNLPAGATVACNWWDTNGFGFISYYQSTGNDILVRLRDSTGADVDANFSIVVFGN